MENAQAHRSEVLPDAALALDNARDRYEIAIADHGRKTPEAEKARIAYHEILTTCRNLGERQRLHNAFNDLPTDPDTGMVDYNDVHDLIDKLFPA